LRKIKLYDITTQLVSIISTIVFMTVPDNKRSIRVMEKLGLTCDQNGDFLHPKLPADRRLSKHILYRKKGN
jgi:RimJ/RimL family protein N-acetyltransferase